MDRPESCSVRNLADALDNEVVPTDPRAEATPHFDRLIVQCMNDMISQYKDPKSKETFDAVTKRATEVLQEVDRTEIKGKGADITKVWPDASVSIDFPRKK